MVTILVILLPYVLLVGIVMYSNKTVEGKIIELKHFNPKVVKGTFEEKTIIYLKNIECNTRSAKNTLMFIRVLYIIALIGGLILISQ